MEAEKEFILCNDKVCEGGRAVDELENALDKISRYEKFIEEKAYTDHWYDWLAHG